MVIGLTALEEEVGKSQNVSVCWLLLAVLASHFKNKETISKELVGLEEETKSLGV